MSLDLKLSIAPPRKALSSGMCPPAGADLAWGTARSYSKGCIAYEITASKHTLPLSEKYADYQSILRRIRDNTLKIQAAIEAMQSIQRGLYGDKT